MFAGVARYDKQSDQNVVLNIVTNLACLWSRGSRTDHVDVGVGELAAACLVALVKQTQSTSTRALETLGQPNAIDALNKALVSNAALG